MDETTVTSDTQRIADLEKKVLVLETANLELQGRALEAELGSMQSTIDLINMRAPIAEQQLKGVRAELNRRRAPPKLQEVS